MTDHSCAPSAGTWNQRRCGVTAGWLTQGLDEASMGKASRTKVDASRRERLADQRRRILIAAGAIVAVVAIVVVIIVLKPGSNKGTSTASNGPTGSALASV